MHGKCEKWKMRQKIAGVENAEKVTYMYGWSDVCFFVSFAFALEWLMCWTQAQKGPGSNRSHDAVGQQS